MITVLIFSIWPSLYNFNPNQNASEKLAYIAKKIRANWIPIKIDIRRPRFCDSSTQEVYFFERVPSAPRDTTVRIEPNTSAAVDECFSSALSTPCWILVIIGSVTLQVTRMNRRAELVTRVKAHEYLKAIMYAASIRARDWNRMASLSEMLCWIELDSVVIVFVTAPTDT